MKVGFYQFVPEFGNVDKNVETMVNAVRSADADLVVFPELATSGYLFLDPKEVEETASTVPGPMSDAFSKVAAETDTAVVVGFPEKADGVYYNSALIATPDGKVQVYRKNHVFNEEKLFFQPGKSFRFTLSQLPHRDLCPFRYDVRDRILGNQINLLPLFLFQLRSECSGAGIRPPRAIKVSLSFVLTGITGA